MNDTVRKIDVQTIPEWAKWAPCKYIHDKIISDCMLNYVA